LKKSESCICNITKNSEKIMYTVQDITRTLENFAPLAYQASYDNAGLLVGNPQQKITAVLLTLDVTEAVIAEAVARNCHLIVAHHPVIFKGLKKITGRTYPERIVMQAIKNDIALYASHTNLDAVQQGVNFQIARQLGLEQVRILQPRRQVLSQLVSFVPPTHTEVVLEALYAAGAGQVGNYAGCSFRAAGTGTFTPGVDTQPFTGMPGKPEMTAEDRIEVIFPSHLQHQVLSVLKRTHPYEEVAYYLTLLENENQAVGAGAVGMLPEAMQVPDFLRFLKEKMNLACIRHTQAVSEMVQKIALCGGTGSFLLPEAIQQKADVFISADFKYHEFFDAENHLLIADIGHYESEIFTKNLLMTILSEKMPNLALVLSATPTNPVHYF
jgi:dinuclear metal center YbgI/SA1388 family protein